MMTKLLLIMGPSGVGKSTIIRCLTEIDPRFVAVKAYTTRKLRAGETEKLSVTLPTFLAMWKMREFLIVNKIFGRFYGTPVAPIEAALNAGMFPVLDWPVNEMAKMAAVMGPRLHRAYIEPPSLAVLRSHISEGRNRRAERLQAAAMELMRIRNGDHDGDLNFRILNRNGAQLATAAAIRRDYLAGISGLSMESNP